MLNHVQLKLLTASFVLLKIAQIFLFEFSRLFQIFSAQNVVALKVSFTAKIKNIWLFDPYFSIRKIRMLKLVTPVLGGAGL